MSEFKPLNPNFEARVRESFARQSFMETLGAKLLKVGVGTVEIELSYRQDLCQQHGFFHGGVIGTMADNAGGYAAFSLMGADDSLLTVEYKMNIVAPGDGDKLIAIGKVKRPGRTLTICEVDVMVEKGGQRKLCATALSTLMTMAGRTDGPKNKS